MNVTTDRRRWRRVPLHCRVSLTSLTTGRTVLAETDDVSTGGLYCHHAGAFSIGESVRFELAMDGDVPVQLHGVGRIVRSTPSRGGTGIAVQIEDYSVIPLPRPERAAGVSGVF